MRPWETGSTKHSRLRGSGRGKQCRRPGFGAPKASASDPRRQLAAIEFAASAVASRRSSRVAQVGATLRPRRPRPRVTTCMRCPSRRRPRIYRSSSVCRRRGRWHRSRSRHHRRVLQSGWRQCPLDPRCHRYVPRPLLPHARRPHRQRVHPLPVARQRRLGRALNGALEVELEPWKPPTRGIYLAEGAARPSPTSRPAVTESRSSPVTREVPAETALAPTRKKPVTPVRRSRPGVPELLEEIIRRANCHCAWRCASGSGSRLLHRDFAR